MKRKDYGALFGSDRTYMGAGIYGNGSWRWLTRKEKAAFRRYIDEKYFQATIS